MKRQISKQIVIVILLLLSLGIMYRLTAFGWNSRIQGDVNLFALTAREITNNSRLFYPMKYEYSDQINYLTLSHPAVQHPPLFPLTAGMLGKFFGSDDTFFFLKSVSLAIGVFLLVIIAVLGIQNGWYLETLFGLLLVGISPIVTDYSANGSPYIISALLITLATYLIIKFRYKQLLDYIFVAILSGLGLQTHGAMIAIPIAFVVVWLLNIKRVRWIGVLITIMSGLLILTPWIIWTYSYFGRPFYTYSTLSLQMTWGVVVEGVFDDIVTTRFVADVDRAFVLSYVPKVVQTYVVFWLFHLLEVGPFCWFLVVAGGWSLFQLNKRIAFQAVIPVLLYSFLPALTTLFRIRYLIPILPITYLLAAWGFARLLSTRRRLAIVGLAGTIIWLVPQFLEVPPTRYYLNDFDLAQNHGRMVELSTALAQRERGVVMGHSSYLVGGVETVYWHRFPFVRGRYHSPNAQEEYPGQILHTLAEDFNVRYIWADETTLDRITTLFPTATLILSEEPFYVFERSVNE